MKHATTIAITVSVAAFLSSACIGASAQVFDTGADPRLTAYYKVPFGTGGRADQGPVLGLSLERPFGSTQHQAGPPAVDLTISVGSGVTELRLNGSRVKYGRYMLDKDGENGSESSVQWGPIILVGAVIAGAVALASKGKDNFEECLDVSGC